MVKILTTIGTFLIILFMTPIKGLDRDHWGTHFVLTFLAYHDTDIKNEVVITAREQCNVSVIFHGTNIEHFIELAAGKSQIYTYDDIITLEPFHQVLPKKAVSVESSRSVSVFGMSRSKKYGDGFLALPTLGLGTEYITVNCNSTGGCEYHDIHISKCIAM
ncbi:hypothetical protein LOTGIDRAFT_155669 [Lottia gigantea]|uniref:IgGFc-binding protein N-terminal domain-containing protein n=1 Tax=Lottia gigantea TaxID=225164 RepID=V3ZP90_LOTGI|nr:hypothetical protein LOTGIDRAFT_155669 [Lottia gigantea]ESO82656.1 hypothetical protein LOTGIDRAFT_155669 [Lottia gigantea]